MEFALIATQEFTVAFESSFDAKEQVRQAVDIVDLVGSYLQLRRQGRGYVALCPWHDDSRPSLQVNPERQSWKCWVCDIGGDVFSFLMKIEGIEFRESLTMLAERAGIQIKKPEPHPHDHHGPYVSSENDEGGQQDRQTLFKAVAWAEHQYHECLLHAPEAEPARKYLRERGISAESIERFHLGFSPLERDWLIRQAGGKPSRLRVLESIGILARPQSPGRSAGGSYFDRFRGRVLFSIRDTQGRPVGCGGRLLPELGLESPAKYVNSPETPLFRKSHLLYGLDQAKDAIRKSKVAMVMEGYTDVIVAHQFGFQNAVAVLGTALGENHVKILKRFADRILLVLDGDEAGQKRSKEVLELFVAQQVDLQILTLPDDLDPCDFLHARGAEAFRDLLDNRAVDAMDHAFHVHTQGLDLDRDIHAASQALERLVAIVAKAPRLRQDTTQEDRLREEKFLQRLAAMFRVDEGEVRRRVTALRRRAAIRPSPANTRIDPRHDDRAAAGSGGAESLGSPGTPFDATERELLELALLYPEIWSAAMERIAAADMAPGPLRMLYETGCRLVDAGETPDFNRFMLEFEDPSVKSLLVELDEQGRAKGTRVGDPLALLAQLASAFHRKEVERKRPSEIVALREKTVDSSEEIALLERIIQRERSRQGITEPMDG